MRTQIIMNPSEGGRRLRRRRRRTVHAALWRELPIRQCNKRHVASGHGIMGVSVGLSYLTPWHGANVLVYHQ